MFPYVKNAIQCYLAKIGKTITNQAEVLMSIRKFLATVAITSILPLAASADHIVKSSHGDKVVNSFGNNVITSAGTVKHLCSDMMYSKTLYFKVGQMNVSAANMKDIKSIIDTLDKGCTVEVAGHTDYTGSKAVNERVSLKRANMVAKSLVKLGVPQHLIKTSGEGYNDLAVNTKKGVSEAKNRRVVISYHY